MMMMMMETMMQTYKMDAVPWSNKVFTYYNFVLLLWTFRKENIKGFCVIDPLNEQHITIIEESHNWPWTGCQSIPFPPGISSGLPG